MLLTPLVFARPVSAPRKVLQQPFVVSFPAKFPTKVLKAPAVPALRPTERFPLLVLADKRRCPPRLNCVCALTVLSESDPLTVRLPPIEPLPEMLKLPVCCVVVFWVKPLGPTPPSCMALPEFRLRIEYGVAVMAARGASIVCGLGLPAGRTPISRKRSGPSKTPAPKSSATVKLPLVTSTDALLIVAPCCVPVPTVAV